MDIKRVLKKIKKNLSKTNKPLLYVGIILFALGLLNIVAASSTSSVSRYDYQLFYYTYKEAAFLLIGVAVFIYIINVSSKNYRIYTYLLLFIAFSTSITLSLVGSMHKGAQNWINIFGFFKFQPSELGKIAIILGLAYCFDLYYKKMKEIKTITNQNYSILGILAFIGLALPIIVLTQKDLGTSLIMFFITLVMFITSPFSRQFKSKIILFGMGTMVALVIFVISIGSQVLTATQFSRLTNFLNPCSSYETTGYQTCNSLIAINNGNIFGLGIGQSKQKYSYIPEAHTDSVFAIISEENGLIGGTAIFLAYLYIIKIILNISKASTTIRGRYIALGVATYIFAHIFLNLGGLMAIIPLTGVPLPFFSYGGTYTISLIMGLALVQRVHIETQESKERK